MLNVELKKNSRSDVAFTVRSRRERATSECAAAEARLFFPINQ
jgi:hypothetical protein